MSRPTGCEEGSITIWMLGLAVSVLFLGGIAVDLWRVAAERRELAGVVDGAAIGAASAIDEAAFRTSGEVRLDVGDARRVACDYLRAHGGLPCSGIAATHQGVRVEADRTVELTLLRILAPGADPVRLRVSASVEPRPAP